MDYYVPLAAAIESEPLAIRLEWPDDTFNGSYEIFRRDNANPVWQKLGDTNDKKFVDRAVARSTSYEYQVRKIVSPAIMGYGYILAGSELPLVENRGEILILVEESLAAPLAVDLERFQFDLVADGWRVVLRLVPADAPPPTVKQIVQQQYTASNKELKALLLLGHVAVPYSGLISPDEHANHVGAWPADVYYGDLDGNWTDHTVHSTTAEKSWNHNIPNDGKWDQSLIPSGVEIEVGRVDLSRLTCFANKIPSLSEVDLMRRYLEKNHRYKRGVITVDQRALIFDNIGSSSPEPLSVSAFRNYRAMVGREIDLISKGEFIPAVKNKSYLWSTVVSGGNFTMSDSVGSADVLALNPVNVVFTTFLGSYYGDWDNESNFLRAVLGASGSTLVSVYSGQPKWLFHQMALGNTVGQATKLTQENGPEGPYPPASVGAGMVHITLHGDPTLRAYPIRPPNMLQLASSGASAILSWSASETPGVRGYLVYKSKSPLGPYSKVTPQLVADTSFTDPAHEADDIYMVRAVALTSTPGGTFWNASLGSFYPNLLGAGESVVPDSPRNLSLNSFSPGAVTLSWVPGSANHTGYKVERRKAGEGDYALVGTVQANVQSLTDNTIALAVSYEYRVRAFNTKGDSEPSAVLVFHPNGAQAEFLSYDTTTKGDWMGAYGAEGHDLFQNVGEYPSYAALTVRDAQVWSGGRVLDPRALWRPVPEGRWATCYLSYSSFYLDLILKDDRYHKIALYFCEFTHQRRGVEIEVLDALTGTRLDYRKLDDLTSGVYVNYALKGNLTIKLTPTTEENIAIWGIFFDKDQVRTAEVAPSSGSFNGKTVLRVTGLEAGADYYYTLDGTVPTPGSTRYTGPLDLYADANFRIRGFRPPLQPSEVAFANLTNVVRNRISVAGWDPETGGNWPGKYGREGWQIAPSIRALPEYAEVRLQNKSDWIWKSETDEPRCLLNGQGGDNRIASAWYSTDSFTVEVAVHDLKSRLVAFYFLDWDRAGREQKIELINGNGQVVDEFTISDFGNGRYLVLNLQGPSKLRITRLKGPNAVMNGLFFDPAPEELGPPMPAPLLNAAITGGEFHFFVEGQAGRRVCLETSSDLTQWTCVETNILQEPVTYLSNTFENSVKAEFFRVHFLP